MSTAVTMQPPLAPQDGQAYQPVVTLNGWTLPWRMKDGWKEFHLVAEPVVREMAPGMKAHLWGYNGASPGPTIEAVEGDKVRIFVTNKLPEHTTVHWHGMLVPNGMDGVGGLTQPHIKPGKTFVYEFVLKKSGTFMYHPHADEMVQMAMGMMGFFVVHPRDPEVHAGGSRFRLSDAELRHRSRQLHAEGHDHARFQFVGLEQPRFPRHRSARGAQGRSRARAHRQSHDDQSSDPHARLSFPCHRHRWRMGSGKRAHPGSFDRRAGWRDARLRICGRRAGRLGDPLPQVASHHERDGARGEEFHRRATRKISPERSASSCPTTCRWARRAWRKWARWKCRCPTTRCR